MNEPTNRVLRDIKALGYMDAIQTGDLDAVAALWDQASHDPELERMLTEVDEALFAEQSGSVNVGATPMVSRFDSDRRTWRSLVGMCVAGALAIACLLAVRFWSGRDVTKPDPRTHPDAVTSHQTDDSVHIAGSHGGRRPVERGNALSFSWPLQTTLSITIPPDLYE